MQTETADSINVLKTSKRTIQHKIKIRRLRSPGKFPPKKPRAENRKIPTTNRIFHFLYLSNTTNLHLQKHTQLYYVCITFVYTRRCV